MLFEDGEAKHPIWRERAVSIAISNLIPVTVGDIDKLIDAGFKLTSSPAMNIDMLDSQEDSPADAFRDWSCTGFYAGMLANLAKQQYGYGTELIGQGDYDRKRLEIAETIPYLFLGALYAARCVAGVRFTEVPVVLYEKLTGRISEGLIDNKADRPEHLLQRCYTIDMDDKAKQFIGDIKQKVSSVPSAADLKDSAGQKLDQVTDRASEAAKNVEDTVKNGSQILDKSLEKAVDSFDNSLKTLDKWLSKF